MIWPFKKKPPPPPRDLDAECLADLRGFRGVGETFEYLGRTCVVTGHMYLAPGFYGPELVPMLRADYCDNRGVVRHLLFRRSELRALEKFNRRSDAFAEKRE